MRDGIYKSLPIPRWWKRALHSCEREAERGETLHRLVERAIETDARKEITPRFLKQLMRVISLDESLLPGLGQLQNIRDSRELGGMNMPLENGVLAKARILYNRGHRDQDMLVEALSECFFQREESIYSQAQPLYLKKYGKGAGAFLSAFRDAQKNAPVRTIANRIIKGERRPNSKMRRPIDVDSDDLSKPL